MARVCDSCRNDLLAVDSRIFAREALKKFPKAKWVEYDSISRENERAGPPWRSDRRWVFAAPTTKRK